MEAMHEWLRYRRLKPRLLLTAWVARLEAVRFHGTSQHFRGERIFKDVMADRYGMAHSSCTLPATFANSPRPQRSAYPASRPWHNILWRSAICAGAHTRGRG